MREYRSPNPTGVLIIILVNVVVFILTTWRPEYKLDPTNIDAFHLAMQGETVLSQPWTVITSLFVHGSLWHILGNMVTLYFFGTYLTMMIGEKRFLLIYFAGGLAGNALILLWTFLTPWGNTLDYVLGASGAVFAVGGALAVLNPNIRTMVYFVIPVPLWVAVIGMFLLTALIPDVSWQGHLGGLLLGVIAGLIIKQGPRRRRREQHLL